MLAEGRIHLLSTGGSPLESDQVNVEATLGNHHARLFVPRIPPPGTASLMMFCAQAHRMLEPYVPELKINKHFNRSAFSIHDHNVSFGTKSMMFYNFVIHFFPLSRTVLDVITLTSPFSTRWL
ncbi:hypothetical protein AVEN_211327-1, partial [Araneus ventricosus]